MLAHKAVTANDKEFHVLGEKEGKDKAKEIRTRQKKY